MEYLSDGTKLQERYTIKNIIGKGAMGTVYLAYDGRLSNDCAVKEMVPSFLEEEEKKQFMELFKQEAHMLNTLDHTNLPKVIDYFLEKDRYYLVMDYIKGRTVKDYIENSSADIETVKKIIYQLCDILEYLHGQHIIFRDLKPSNIMILPDFKVKLIDFGIARIFKDSRQYDTVIVGTPGFCPPEQYGRGQTDERSDIYSLGANLYYMLTGNVPDLPVEKGRKEIESNSNLAPELRSLILKCLSSEPEKRFCTISDFRKAFEDVWRKKLPVHVQKQAVVSPEDNKPVHTVTGTVFTFAFMLLPSGILTSFFYLFGAKLLSIIPAGISSIFMWLLDIVSPSVLSSVPVFLPLLGLFFFTGLFYMVIRKMKSIPGINWEALILVTIPFVILNARNFYALTIPLPGYEAGRLSAVLLLALAVPFMILASVIFMNVLRIKKRESKEIPLIEKKSKEAFTGHFATVTSPMRPAGKILIDGEEEAFSACSCDGQFIKEGTRVKITGLKMGDFIVESITDLSKSM